MVTVADSLGELRAREASGELASLCAELDLDLLVLHGSALRDVDTAGDIDLAYVPARGTRPDHLAVVMGLERLVAGDHLDVMPLHRADPVAQWAALGRGEPLVERRPSLFAEAQIRAFREYCDTQKFRDLALSLVGR